MARSKRPPSLGRSAGQRAGAYALLDRIDMSIEVPNIPQEVLLQTAPEAETSALVRERVRHVRARQLERAGKPSSRLGLA